MVLLRRFQIAGFPLESLPELDFIYGQAMLIIQVYANPNRRLIGGVVEKAAPIVIDLLFSN